MESRGWLVFFGERRRYEERVFERRDWLVFFGERRRYEERVF